MLRYALTTWWRDRNGDEETASLRELTYGRGSPGMVFRMEEGELRDRLFDLCGEPDAGFSVRESANQLMVIRTEPLDQIEVLRAAYRTQAPAAAYAHAR